MKGTNFGSGGTICRICSGTSGYLKGRPRFLGIWSEGSAAAAAATSGVLKGRPLFFAVDCKEGGFLKGRPRFLVVVEGLSNVLLARLFTGGEPKTTENVEGRTGVAAGGPGVEAFGSKLG